MPSGEVCQLPHCSDVFDKARCLQRPLLWGEMSPCQSKHSPFDLAWSICPLESVGGDFVLAAPLSRGRMFLLLGDAMGHGPRAHTMAQFARTALHHSLQAGVNRPGSVFDRLNFLLAQRFPDAFVTGAACLLDAQKGMLTWSTAGHPPIFLRTTAGATVLLSEPACPLGLNDEPYQEHTISCTPGSTILLYSDGIGDALAFTKADKIRILTDLLERTCSYGVRIVARTVARMAQHCGHREDRHLDDQAVLVARLVN